MSNESVEITFYLIGGQTVTVYINLKEGATLDKESIRELVKWRELSDMFLIEENNKWGLTVPDMKNVAMVMFKPSKE